MAEETVIAEGKAITPDKKFVLVDEINKELNSIKEAVLKGGAKAANSSAITSSKDLLQNILNDLFNKRGIITPDETDKALNAIKESKKARLQSDFKSSVKKYAIVIAALVGVGVGLYFYTKNKSK